MLIIEMDGVATLPYNTSVISADQRFTVYVYLLLLYCISS